MYRKIPTSMMTPHPDSASKYIPVQEEPMEAVRCLIPPPNGLGIEEVMVDFEGKLTPYHQTVQVVTGLLEHGMIPGKEVFVTPRIASASAETVFRQMMALMSVVETNVKALEKSETQAVTEVIAPMCETAAEMLDIRRRINNVIELAHKEFNLPAEPDSIRLIPLIEGVPELLQLDSIFPKYIEEARKQGASIRRLRFMIGRSDPALSYGMPAAALASVTAIAKAYDIGEKYEAEIAPILGAGSLPFRGHITAENLSDALKTYAGVKTITIQSALRYDHGPGKTRFIVQKLKEKLPKTKPRQFTKTEIQDIYTFTGIFVKHYLQTFLQVIDVICPLADIIPQQRDRLTRYSSVGYARDVARPDRLVPLLKDPGLIDSLTSFNTNIKVSLPRAITYTGAMYSIGCPPEIVGTGRALKELRQRFGKEYLPELLYFYPSLKSDLAFAARFVNLSSSSNFLPSAVISELEEDVKGIEEELEITCGPKEESDHLYHVLSETIKPLLKHILQGGSNENTEEEQSLIQDCLVRQGKIRGSLG
ncbi:MAG: phosphoenolpyruvate carboxylase [Dethiobacteria bacterium]|jgi:phosphoenolpyruvate carboxylase|nr:phosphoenolpyruvate carboxylase [Bacillota bacterium]